jgi:membrane-associated protease RseP (regulator of RpoE activity)
MRPLLLIGALVLAAALAVLWRTHPQRATPHDAAQAPAAVSSGVPPFSPVPLAPSATGNPTAPTPQLPAAAAPTTPAAPAAEAADASAPSGPEADVERRQNAKIARGLTDGESGGVLVQAAPPGSVASALHLKPGDLITAVNGQPLTSTEQFIQLYRAEGLPNQLTVQREGREVHVH